MIIRLREKIEYLVKNTSQSCCVQTTKRKRGRRDMAEFLFCNRSGDVRVMVVAGLVSAGAMAISGGFTGAAVAACVPIIVPVTNSLVEAGVPISEGAKRSMSHMLMVNSAQLSFGMVEFLTGDIVNGFVHMMMAGVGFYVTRVDGIVMLPSFSVGSTVFAGVSLLNVVDMFLHSGGISGELPLTINFVKLGTFFHPVLYALSAWYAWKLIEQLRSGLLTEGGRNMTGVVDTQVERVPFVGRPHTIVADAN